MSEYVTDEMVEQALRFSDAEMLDRLKIKTGWSDVRERMMRAALESAAPLIAAQALGDLADEWREAYSADIFPCGTDDLRHINATSGPNSTAKVAAYFARHWADVLSARADEIEAGR